MPSRQDLPAEIRRRAAHTVGPTSRRSCPGIQARKRRTVPHRVRHAAGGNALRCGCGFRRVLAPTVLRRCEPPTTLLTDVQNDAELTNRSSLCASPPQQRRQITTQLRTAVVEAYRSGKTSRQVAREFALGRSTVLTILKAAGVTVRPQGPQIAAYSPNGLDLRKSAR